MQQAVVVVEIAEGGVEGATCEQAAGLVVQTRERQGCVLLHADLALAVIQAPPFAFSVRRLTWPRWLVSAVVSRLMPPVAVTRPCWLSMAANLSSPAGRDGTGVPPEFVPVPVPLPPVLPEPVVPPSLRRRCRWRPLRQYRCRGAAGAVRGAGCCLAQHAIRVIGAANVHIQRGRTALHNLAACVQQGAARATQLDTACLDAAATVVDIASHCGNQLPASVHTAGVGHGSRLERQVFARLHLALVLDRFPRIYLHALRCGQRAGILKARLRK